MFATCWLSDVFLKDTPLENFCLGAAAAATALKPRYFFTGGCNVFYERQPFSNNVSKMSPKPVTRYFSVARVGNAEKKKVHQVLVKSCCWLMFFKWLYAFNIIPTCYMDPVALCSAPATTTPNPFKSQEAPAQPDTVLLQPWVDLHCDWLFL